MAREHRILSRLPDALPFVPRSLLLCDDPSVCGQRFQILEYRPGLVIRETHAARARRSSRTSARGCREVLLETIAAIHAVDTAAIGLDDLGRPEGFLARAVSGWGKRGWAAKEDGTDALHQDDRRLAGTQHRAGRQARTSAQRLQAEQHDPEPGRSVAGRRGGLGPGHPRRSVVRFRHAAVLLDSRRRSMGHARHGTNARRRGGPVSAPGGGRGIRAADRPRRVRTFCSIA